MSQDLGDRKSNPYHDMEFWSNVRSSVFRPQYFVDLLKKNSLFSYNADCIVTSWEEHLNKVQIFTQNTKGEITKTYNSKALLLCAGAIQTGRIALNSLKLKDYKTPILSNPYVYIPSINWATLGSKGIENRHSLSQLFGLYNATGDSFLNTSSLQFYSYRSLLLFKLVKEIPLPPKSGLKIARLLMNALTIVGIHHPDDGNGDQYMYINNDNPFSLPTLNIAYKQNKQSLDSNFLVEKNIFQLMRLLKCYPIKKIHPGKASSIHYAGTAPFNNYKLGANLDGCISSTKRIFIGDSSTWRFLPSKGPTFTIMANAMRIADCIADQFSEKLK